MRVRRFTNCAKQAHSIPLFLLPEGRLDSNALRREERMMMLMGTKE
jgi:hypothetical protein